MTIRLLTIVFILLLAFCGVFTGCIRKSPASDNTTPKETNKEPVKLKFTYWGSPFEKSVIEESLKEFEKKYNYITVEPIYIPGEYNTKLTSMIAGNTAPDVGYVSDTVILPWAEEGKFLNLYDFMAKDTELKKEDILPTAFFDWAPGKCAGLTSAQEGFALMYNKDMFEQAGVSLPPTKAQDAWDWDQFVKVCQRLTLDNKGRNALDPHFDAKNIKQYGVEVDNYVGCYMSVVLSNGGNWLTSDGKEFGLAKPEAYEAIQKLADLINVYHVAPSLTEMKSLPDIPIALDVKKVAMAFAGNYTLLDLAQQDFELGIGVLPKLSAGSKTFVVSGATSIFSTTKYPEESWMLLKWLENPDSSIELQAGGLWMPILKKWYTDPVLVSKWAENNKAHPDGYTDAMMKQVLVNGIASPGVNVKNYGKMNIIVSPVLDKIWLGEDSAEHALKSIEPQVKPLIQGYYAK